MSTRLVSFFGFATCAFLIAFALYFQHVDGLEPCPLCIFQRIAFIAMGLVFLACLVQNPIGFGRTIYGLLAMLSGLVGAAIAGRHVWLQNLPEDQVPECGPGLAFMLDAFPFQKVIETVLKGSGECAEVSWTFLGLTMPGWSLVWLILLTLLSMVLAFSRSR
jgi:disulfide bond formation protein DsbB